MKIFNLNNLLSITCCFLLLTACDQKQRKVTVSQTAEASAASTTTLIRSGEFTSFSLDPHQVNDLQNTAILYDLYEGLVGYDIHGNIIPAIAQSWESKDQKVWLFHLRSDAKWSDGSPVTATDFVQSWQTLLSSKATLAKYLAFIAVQNAEQILTDKLPVTTLGVQAIDDLTLQIQLDKANAHLPTMLAHIALVPIDKKSRYNGAYQLMDINEQKLQLTVNPYYWNKTQISFQNVEYWHDNLTSAPIDWQLATKKTGSATQFVPKLCSYYYELNPHHPTLQNIAVRQALISLISSQAATQNVAIQGKAGAGLLPQSMRFTTYFNLPPTEQLLKQANINNQRPLAINLTFDNSMINQQIAENLSRQFAQSDLIKITLQAKTQTEWANQHIQQQFQLIRSGWCADYNDPSAFLNIFHSKSPDNLMRYHNPNVDQWLERAMVETKEEQRQQLYQQVVDTLTQDAVILPLFQYYLPVYIAPNLSGYDLNNPTQVFYSKDLYRLVH